ncbi:MAG: hypothetical protein AAF074_07650 [Pseudomonadota bacterium]
MKPWIVGAAQPNNIRLRIFYAYPTKQFFENDAGAVAQQIITSCKRAAKVMAPYKIGVKVLANGEDRIGFYPASANLLSRGKDRFGTTRVIEPTARAIRKRISNDHGAITKECVILFGALGVNLNGHTVETGATPSASDPYWFSCVNIQGHHPTTMIHEIVHLAGFFHWHARRDHADRSTVDQTHLMASAENKLVKSYDHRATLFPKQMAKFRGAFFYE